MATVCQRLSAQLRVNVGSGGRRGEDEEARHAMDKQ